MSNQKLYEEIADFLNGLTQKYSEQEIEHTIKYILEERGIEREM